ncbi:MAG TPA: sigma-70 family RNA polymerase sigma factor [Polyangiaceae bacterium]|nr:sigma-70 family RNA polymerase sigma factor [Polyangiaceae bacterium]
MPASPRRAPHLRIVGDHAPGELSEASLAEALQRREPWAAEAVWKRYAPSVYGLLARGLGRGAEPEALTQAVFFRAFTRIRSLEEPAALRSFVYSHAAIVLRRELRRRWLRRVFSRSRRAVTSDEAKWLLDRPMRLVLARLYDVLDQLSPTDRVIFSLRQLEGLSYAELAEVLGKPVAFVKRKVTRVSARLEVLVRSDPLLDHYVAQPRLSEAEQQEGA